jgi:hypothetical protein
MLVLGSPALASAAPADHQDPTAVVDMFFGKLKAGPSIDAYRGIWTGTLMDKKPGQLQFLADQTDTVLRYYGPVTGWELLREGPGSLHLKDKTYVLRTQGGPIFFRFQLFDDGTHWMISKLTFNDDVDKLASTPVMQ